MRIAYICADFGVPVFGFKGASVHVREMVGAWQRMGHEVVVFSPRVEAHDGITAVIPTVHVPHTPLYTEVAEELKSLDEFLNMPTRIRQDLRNMLYHLTLYNTVEPHMTQAPFDLVYERYTLFNYAGIKLARHFGLPHILEVNAPLCYEQEKMRGLEMKRIAHELERRIFNDTDCVSVVSKQLGDFVQTHGVPPEHILLSPNGVNPHVFKPMPQAGRDIRAKYGLGEQVVMGFVGSLKSWHGTDSLVAAFCELRQAGNPVHLLIVGDGPERSTLEQQVADAGLTSHVTFTGKVPHDQIPAHIAAMDISVAPYIPNDNFYFSPIKIFEYMAVGSAVVAGSIGQTEEIVQQGKTGLLYEPGNVTALRVTLQCLIDDPDLRSRLGQAGHEMVITQHTWDQVATNVLEVVTEVGHARSVTGTSNTSR